MLPLPGEPTERRPGWALAPASTSAMLLYGVAALVAQTIGASLIVLIGAKSSHL